MQSPLSATVFGVIFSLTVVAIASAQDTVSCPPWTDNPIVSGQTPIRAQHINELRTCFDRVLEALNRRVPPPLPLPLPLAAAVPRTWER